MMLAVGVIAPQMVSACGMGPPPELSNVQVAPGQMAATITFDTEYARGSTLVLWSDDAPQSKLLLDDSPDTIQHVFNLATLQPDTGYHYQIQLRDPADDAYVAYTADLRTLPSSGQ
jgi:hypothetical protein